MVNEESHLENPPQLDEYWWAAILSEEEKQCQGLSGGFTSVDISIDGKEATQEIQSKSVPIDWEQAQQLFTSDDMVELEVTGYNRGGLLVSGDGLHGFVPVSHLLDVNGDINEPDRDTTLADYIGRTVFLKVIECDPERGRVVFSERAALAESGRRNQIFENITPGDNVQGVVTNITDFGVFVDLGGVEGLIHVSELSWGRVRHPSDVAEVGKDLSAYVIHVDKSRSRIALSLKQLYPNPWETAEDHYKPGQIVDAVVTSVVPFGAFARLEEGLDGLIHTSEMDLNEETGRVEDVLNEGQRVKVRIISVSPSKQRLGLSLKINGD
jgi:small subunit ribosomal protein S1